MLRLMALMIGLLVAGQARAADNLLAEWPASLDLAMASPDRPVFSGHVELPDDMPVLVSLRRTGSVGLADRAPYEAQSQSAVRGGHFQTENFTNDGGKLSPGEYLVEIDMALPADFADIPLRVGDPAAAIKENTKHVVLTGRVYAGRIAKYAEYRIPLYIHMTPIVGEACCWFGVPY